MPNDSYDKIDIIGKSCDENNKFVFWRTCMQIWDSECNRFWVRSNVFLIFNGILITFLTTRSNTSFLTIFGSLSGLIISIIWYRVNVKGKWYIDRWRPVIIEIEKNLNIAVFQKLRSISAISDKKIKPSTTQMKYAIITFGIIYSIFLIISSYIYIIALANKNVLFETPIRVENDILDTKNISILQAVLEGNNFENLKVEIIVSELQYKNIKGLNKTLLDILTKMGFKKDKITFLVKNNEDKLAKLIIKHSVIWLRIRRLKENMCLKI